MHVDCHPMLGPAIGTKMCVAHRREHVHMPLYITSLCLRGAHRMLIRPAPAMQYVLLARPPHTSCNNSHSPPPAASLLTSASLSSLKQLDCVLQHGT